MGPSARAWRIWIVLGVCVASIAWSSHPGFSINRVIFVVIMTIVGQRFRGMELAVANVAMGMLWGIGSLTGPSMTGIAMDIRDPEGFALVFIFASGVFLLLSLGRWLLARDRSAVL